jgi:hypothetical protein
MESFGVGGTAQPAACFGGIDMQVNEKMNLS